MDKISLRRPKLVFFPSKCAPPTPGRSEEDYRVYASCRPGSSGRFMGTLKVVRVTDGRLLFPFHGAEELGPFEAREAAKNAAKQRGMEIVEADLHSPELNRKECRTSRQRRLDWLREVV
ncbi:DUF6723 family protein [Caballeronia sp. GaOx3]|uniref:DUF6723 family protein n=1 Tax=Caballeronia sp. GaOx3 TaxID=2921740 RepID=UPI0020283F53|nr:DUF6723 family protein [Caballeronia sp. GaOx3]